MAAYLFAVFLGVLTIAATAAGLAIPDYALAWWILAGVLGIATVAVALWEWRRRTPGDPRSDRVTTKGTHSPAIKQSGSHNTITLGGSSPIWPIGVDSFELLRAARGPLRNAIAAFADKAAFERDPLRFQRHEFGEPTAEIRKVIRTHWPSREPDVDKALANEPPRGEYEWRRAALKRLDTFVGTILEDEPPDPDASPSGGRSGPTDAQAIPASQSDDEPPEDWPSQFWRGKRTTDCPWDRYRTINDAHWIEHLETHTEPPTPELAQGITKVPMQWAKTPLHYLGGPDGPSFSGVPADPDHTIYATTVRAGELIATGLYGPGPVEGQEHASSGAVGRTLVCTCGSFEAATTAEFQSHLSATGST